MRRFHSYGPVNVRSRFPVPPTDLDEQCLYLLFGNYNEDDHYSVPRKDLVDQCLNSLIGSDHESGHYFTIWAPRQTGKTWLTRQVVQEIKATYQDQYEIMSFSLGILRSISIPKDQISDEVPKFFSDIISEKFPNEPNVKDWKEFRDMFSRNKGLWDRPLIMLIDEVDTLPSFWLDVLVGQFREMYLDREANWLHGLSLIGVQAVDSERGSPFNVQKSLQVPNLTLCEVTALFDQYQQESGQVVEPEVVVNVYESTNGQPCLVGWFGELLTEKYNPGNGRSIDPNTWREITDLFDRDQLENDQIVEPELDGSVYESTIGLPCQAGLFGESLTEKYNPGNDRSIDPNTWETVHHAALTLEWNNTVMNLVKKVRMGYVPHVLGLFSRPDVSFSIDTEWCAYLYMNGVIVPKLQTDENGRKTSVCRFSCPFIQKRLYNALTDDLIGDRLPMLAIEPLDDLADVFEGEILNLPSLLDRYKAYLVRMKAQGLSPFKNQPQITDLHYTEAVGHFHLYAWLQAAIGRRCVTSPEFPTGNCKVDIHIRCNGKKGIIEVKSFVDMSETRKGTAQAAAYARSLNLNSVTLALFVPVDDKAVLAKLSGENQSDDVTVTVVAIGWT